MTAGPTKASKGKTKATATKPATIAVVTGTRAEFGLLSSTMHAIDAHPNLHLQTWVAGAHFVTGSYKDVQAQGFAIDVRVRMQTKGHTGRLADAIALGKGVSGFAKALQHSRPDCLLVLGDRIEAFAAASAAAIGGVHVAHIHGGDRAEGVADESMRHAISKLAHLHFPATQQSAQRLLAMGENSKTIFCVGSPAADGLNLVQACLPPEEATVAPTRKTTQGQPVPHVLIMHHPVGQTNDAEQQTMQAILQATAGCRRTVLAPNLDPGREGILAALQEASIEPITHVPRPTFLQWLKAADAIVGNSSAGLIEAAILQTPCVNVGPRQNGREKPNSVFDAKPSQRGIQTALKQALALDRQQIQHPYGGGLIGQRITKQLAKTPWNRLPIAKQNTF